MAIRGLDHVNISTTKLAETKAFFIDVLGLEDGWRPPLSFDGAWLYANGRDVVHLAERKQAPRPSSRSALDHFAFDISDYDEALRRVKATGFKFYELTGPGTSVKQIFVTEGNGVSVELNWKGPTPRG